MSHDETTATVEGEITHVFAHRFLVRTVEGSVLADVGPKGTKKASPAVGDKVRLTGRRKPSELKVATFERDGKTIELGEVGGMRRDPPADPAAAVAAVERLGQTVQAAPRRRPRHFEILATDAKGHHHEHHVGLDGEIRRSKAGDPAEKKWEPPAPAAD